MLANESKTLLKNTLAHTDVHNKAWEERLCWKQHEKEKKISNYFSTNQNHLGRNKKRNRSSSSESADNDLPSTSHGKDEPYYWTKKLQEFEAADTERWGHSGYKDLYPEQFDNDVDDSTKDKTSCVSLHLKKRKKKRRYSTTSNSSVNSTERASSKSKRKRKHKKRKKSKKKKHKR